MIADVRPPRVIRELSLLKLPMRIRICFPSKEDDYCDWVSVLDSYKRYVFSSAKVLEIGASEPRRTRELSRWCQELIGIELFPDRTPPDFGNVHYVTGDWQELSTIVQLESIDLAVSTHVIEHVPNDLQAINELYRVLKPGGCAILNTPNRKRLVREIVESFAGERKFPYWEHQREYVEDDLKQLLDRSRFPKYSIIPVAFGVHGGPLFIYSTSVPVWLRRMANFWEIHLFKE